jgi:hypothetical protein
MSKRLDCAALRRREIRFRKPPDIRESASVNPYRLTPIARNDEKTKPVSLVQTFVSIGIAARLVTEKLAQGIAADSPSANLHNGDFE